MLMFSAFDPSLYLNDPDTGVDITPLALKAGEGQPDPMLSWEGIDETPSYSPKQVYHKAHGNISKESKFRAEIMSPHVRIADEDALTRQGAVKALGDTYIRVEVPMSETMSRSLGVDPSQGWVDQSDSEGEEEGAERDDGGIEDAVEGGMLAGLPSSFVTRYGHDGAMSPRDPSEIAETPLITTTAPSEAQSRSTVEGDDGAFADAVDWATTVLDEYAAIEA